MGNVRTYLYFTVVTVSAATLLPTSFAPVSRLDQIVEKPGLGVNGKKKFEYSKNTWILHLIQHFKCQFMTEYFDILCQIELMI